MTAPRRKCFDVADAALTLCRPDPDLSPTLDDLTARLSHIKATQPEWREAVAHLAAQVWAERKLSDSKRGREAIDTIQAIEQRIAWFREHNP